jgi:hypothetical protein
MPPGVCPQCQTAWAVWRGQCGNCGYGMPSPQPLPAPPMQPQPTPIPGNDLLAYAWEHVVVPGREQQGLPDWVSPSPSAPQPETPTRDEEERLALAGQVDELTKTQGDLLQRLEVMDGQMKRQLEAMRRFVEPLLAWWAQHGTPLEVADVITKTVQLLDHYARARVEGKPDPAPQPRTGAGGMPADGVILASLDALRRSIDLLTQQFSSTPPVAPPTQAAGWLQSDQRIAQLEREAMANPYRTEFPG